MILAGNQPYFLPYLGYWQLIHAARGEQVVESYAREALVFEVRPEVRKVTLRQGTHPEQGI